MVQRCQFSNGIGRSPRHLCLKDGRCVCRWKDETQAAGALAVRAVDSGT